MTSTTPNAGGAPKAIIYDTASLRALLPAAQKHLVPKASEFVSEPRGSTVEQLLQQQPRHSPITQVCQSLSRLHCAERSYTKNSQMVSNNANNLESSGVQLVKVKQAWTASPEAATSIEVVRRRKKSEPTTSTERNLNLINNNNGSSDGADLNLKRRSYHPQDYLSQVLDPAVEAALAQQVSATRLKRRDFPKVWRLFFGLFI